MTALGHPAAKFPEKRTFLRKNGQRPELERIGFEEFAERVLRDSIPDSYERFSVVAEMSKKINNSRIREFIVNYLPHVKEGKPAGDILRDFIQEQTPTQRSERITRALSKL